MPTKITMSDLARLAGVDVSTISRALNDSPLVKQKTKDHIIALATANGYVINASARSLRKQSSQTLGIVIPLDPKSGQTISDPFFLEMVGAVSHAAAKRNYDLIINIPQDKAQIAERRLLQTGRADGLIVIGEAGRLDRLNALGDLANRIVVWGGSKDQANYTVVGSDNIEGGRLAAQHLLDTGRRNILFLGDRDLPEVALRYDGFLACHKDYGRSHDHQLSASIPFGGKAAFKALQALFENVTGFDAIFATSDVLAMAAIHALASKGIKIPDDVAIVGYDNIEQSAMATPSLTTIDQSISLGGEIMVKALLDKINGRQVPSQLTPTKLIVRNSTIIERNSRN